MSSQAQSSGGARARGNWLPTLILAALAAAAGYYWAGPPGPTGRTEQDSPAAAPKHFGHATRPDPPGAAPADVGSVRLDRSATPKLHRMTLSAADVKDTQGAPDIAVDGNGRVHLVWASITGEKEQTCYLASSPG